MLITTLLTLAVLAPVFAIALGPSIVALVTHERERRAHALVRSLRERVDAVELDDYSAEAA